MRDRMLVLGGSVAAELGLHSLAAYCRDEILRHTRALQEHEQQTVEACRDLKSRLAGDDRELFEALLDAIALDSEKHHRLLAAVARLA